MAAIALSTAGLGCLVPGALGAVLGGLELTAIRRGDAPSAGETYAFLAILLGASESVALAVWAVVSLM